MGIYNDKAPGNVNEKKKIDAAMLFESQMFRFSKFLLEDDSFPEGLEKWFWAFHDKEAALTNLGKENVTRLMRTVDNTIYFYLSCKPAFEYSFEEEVALQQMKGKIYMKLLRSTGGRDRERFILGSQIQQNILEDNGGARPKGGIVNSVKKMFGGR